VAAVNMVARAVDDFCGTPPGRFPWPRPWPGPGSGGGDPDPHPWLVAEMRLVAAVQMATIASRMAEGEAREALSVGADQLAQAAVGQRETAAA
jgi:hypothetical protein